MDLHPIRALLLAGASLAAMATSVAAQDQSEPDPRSGLRVLFVGQDPAAPKPQVASVATERDVEMARERTPAFQALLESHFQHVQVVYGADYTVEMSDEVDVTVFDALPPVLDPGERSATTYRPAVLLPETFDRPALFIAEKAARIGDGIGLKLDWL